MLLPERFEYVNTVELFTRDSAGGADFCGCEASWKAKRPPYVGVTPRIEYVARCDYLGEIMLRGTKVPEKLLDRGVGFSCFLL